ncbi:hypothetical protein BGZ76_003943 [Entomortierella beljakovae]|nr:hypothetical protein BGZ76_003943 [Entomortierella beljakovae]
MENWAKSCAGGSGALLLPMSFFADCQNLFKPLGGEPHVSAHVNMGSQFEVAQKAAVSCLLDEVRSMADLGVSEKDKMGPLYRGQKLYVAEIEYQDAPVKGRIITVAQGSVLVIIGIIGSVGASICSVIYLWTYIAAVLITTSAAIFHYQGLPTTVTPSTRTRAYVVTPNWNSEEIFMLIGDGDELAMILNRPAPPSPYKNTAIISASIASFFVTVASALLLGQNEPRTHLTMLAFVCVCWVDWCPAKYRRRWCQKAIVHTLERRRTAYTAIRVLHGKSQQSGWWSQAFPTTQRIQYWTDAIDSACSGVMLPKNEIDDLKDFGSAAVVLKVTCNAGFVPIMKGAKAGLETFINVALDLKSGN